MIFICPAAWLMSADLREVESLYRSGRYEEVIQSAKEAADKGYSSEDWALWIVKSQMRAGRYPEALETLEDNLRKHPFGVRLRLLGYDVYRQNGDLDRANELVQQVARMSQTRSYRFQNAPDLVALGKAALILDNDPKLVLENAFDRAREIDPNYRGSYLASGQLALRKKDYALASEAFNAANEKFPGDPEILGGLAASFAPSDRSKMMEYANLALEKNPRHAPSLLLIADHFIDSEQYEAAREAIEKVLEVNPWDPEAWAYTAVIDHIKNDAEGEARARENALKFWPTNPHVESLIGRKLSQKYRFAEGAEYQRRALKSNPDFTPAKVRLAQDLLRLGREEEGWELALDVHEKDAYDVEAFNLATLRDTMKNFTTLANEHFIVRMGGEEAKVFGDAVVDLLEEARAVLIEKYGFAVQDPTTVEIFPNQNDFGVRTFGMPDNPGYLGVCFGSVITANSPSAQSGTPANWKSVLWHEFCHVVTLQMTKNKMPRWLSEGISVYEEIQANPVWGQHMNPDYRSMILEGEMAPVSELSAAFLSPKSSKHLDFAYFQAYLVVDYLVRHFGMESLQNILRDLGDGEAINPTLEKHTAPIDELDEAFEEHATTLAKEFAPKLDWDKPDQGLIVQDDTAWELAHPNNYWVLIQKAQRLIGEEQWEEALKPLLKLIELYPEQTGLHSALSLLAQVYGAMGEAEKERETLVQLAVRDNNALSAYARLMEMDAGTGNWDSVTKNARRYLAVNPLVSLPYRYMAMASEAAGEEGLAIEAYRKQLLLEPVDPAHVHFRLASLLNERGEPAAKRHALQALEEAPRYREAHRLLLQLAREQGDPDAKANQGRPSEEE